MCAEYSAPLAPTTPGCFTHYRKRSLAALLRTLPAPFLFGFPSVQTEEQNYLIPYPSAPSNAMATISCR